MLATFARSIIAEANDFQIAHCRHGSAGISWLPKIQRQRAHARAGQQGEERVPPCLDELRTLRLGTRRAQTSEQSATRLVWRAAPHKPGRRARHPYPDETRCRGGENARADREEPFVRSRSLCEEFRDHDPTARWLVVRLSVEWRPAAARPRGRFGEAIASCFQFTYGIAVRDGQSADRRGAESGKQSG